MENNPQHNIYQEESIDIKKYLFKFLANWYWFAIALSVALAIAYMVNRYSEPTYTISSSVIIGNSQAEMGSINALISELGMNRRRMRTEVVNEISILKSYSMARRAIEQLDFDITYISVGRREIAETKMYHNCPFIVIPDTSYLQLKGYPINIKILSDQEYLLEINDLFNVKKKMQFDQTFENESFKFIVKLRDPVSFSFKESASNKYYFYFNDKNSLAKQYRAKLNVEPNQERGSILSLKINGSVPAKMAAYLNKLCEVYIQSDLNEQNKQAQNTIDFIDEQLQVIVDSLNKVESRLQKFRSDNQIFDLDQKGNILMEELKSLQNRKMEIELYNRYYSYVEKYLANKDYTKFIVNPTSLSISNPSLEKLVDSYNTSLSKLNQMGIITNEPNPNTTLLNQNLVALKESIAEQVKVGKNLNQINEEELKQKIKQTEQEINKLPVNERNLVNIEREYKLNNGLYTFLLEKQAEAGITKASNVSNNKVLDVAMPENAGMLTPKRSQNYMIALILGLGIPAAIILLLDFMNTKIEDKKDIEKSTHIPIIGTVGHDETHSNIPVFINSNSGLAESFRTLRTNLQFILGNKESKIIMMTSTISGEGKTFAAVNLATIMAMASKKTLLVGLDLRKPSLHKIFDISNETGISNMLIGQQKIEEIIKETHVENLFLAPSGPIPPNPAELIETTQAEKFFTWCKEHFDTVIIDTPPVALVTDALLTGKYSDANIFIVRQKYSSKHVFELINRIYHEKRLEKMNILVNDIKIKKYYGYEYGYGYGYEYGYGYTNK